MPYPKQHSFKARQRWYYQVDRCEKSVTEVCKIFGISRKCYYQHRRKDSSVDRTYHPAQRQPATKLTMDMRLFIEREKAITNYGPLKMKLRLKQVFGVDLSTTVIYRYYKRKHLIRKPQKKLPWYEPLKEHLVITGVGQGVQMDVKYVWIGSHRQYQFSVFDPYTEQYYFRIFPTRHSRNATTVFKEAQVYWGMRIVSVQTDNGSEFRGEFHDWLTRQNLPHHFIPKSSPYWNGKVERVHRTMDDEYYLNPLRVWRTPMEWLWFYNRERIHLSINGLTPRQSYLQTCNP